MSGRYDDIINLPHHVSDRRERMSMDDRAAQFAPFAALNGHGAIIAEAARQTESKPEMTPERLSELSNRLTYAMTMTPLPELVISYFKQDHYKSGGCIKTTRGVVNKIDRTDGILFLNSGQEIELDSICDIDGEIFD